MKKNSCTPINPKKMFMLQPKKNSYKEFDDEKKIPAARKFPPPPHNFSNGPSLMLQQLNTRSTNRTVCLDLFAIYIMLSMSVKTNLHITVRTCQIERKNDCWLLPKRIVPRNNFFNLDGRALHFRAELLKAWLALTIG